VVGLGIMGRDHAANLAGGRVPGAILSAVCDRSADATSRFPAVPGFATTRALAEAKACDVAVIATPHFDHPDSATCLLAAGVHCLVEKPIAVHCAESDRLLTAWRALPVPRPRLAVNLMQRTDPKHRCLRDLIAAGELGRIQRAHWTITDWFRSDAYYAAGGWRATWRGEGGGVLVNQCPHQLDLLCWLLGDPVAVTALCRFGAHHPIEVEDEAFAIVEFASGAVATIATSTGEAPGANRLEVAGTRGLVIMDSGDGLRWRRNSCDSAAFCRQTRELFGRPDCWEVEVPVRGWHLEDGRDGQYAAVLADLVEAIRHDRAPLAPPEDAARAVELANAILLSSRRGRRIVLPLDRAEVLAEWGALAQSSRWTGERRA
jgi:predicted dehydrogenase